MMNKFDQLVWDVKLNGDVLCLTDKKEEATAKRVIANGLLVGATITISPIDHKATEVDQVEVAYVRLGHEYKQWLRADTPLALKDRPTGRTRTVNRSSGESVQRGSALIVASNEQAFNEWLGLQDKDE